MNRSVTEMLGKAGVNPTVVSLIAPIVISGSPQTSPPTSNSTMMVVRVMQSLLRTRLGYKIHVSGTVDTETATALSIVVGKNWQQLSWIDSIGTILRAPSIPGVSVRDEFEEYAKRMEQPRMRPPLPLSDEPLPSDERRFLGMKPPIAIGLGIAAVWVLKR